jgi:dipeptide/tripeptide permease
LASINLIQPLSKEEMEPPASFYNWYYTTQTVIMLINQTLVVYIQDSVSWPLGFGVPTVLMCCAIILLFAGTKIYVHVKPEGTMFSGIMQVFIAAYKNRRLTLPADGEVVGIFYDPPLEESVASKLPLTE